MRGEVLHYDEAQGFGFISGADGNRYTFRREDLRREATLTKGTAVEFEARDGQASNVFSIRATVQAAPPSVPQQFGRNASAGFEPPAMISGPPALGLWGYFRRCFGSSYANFRERARRKEYWGYYLFWMLSFFVLMAASIALDAAMGNLSGNDVPFVTMIVSVLFVLASIVPSIAVTVRRIHDIGLSGWFYLLIFLPYVGGIIIFVFSLIPSQAHENKWGPVPAGIVPRYPAAPPASPQTPATPPAA